MLTNDSEWVYAETTNCRVPCRLGLDQTQSLVVQNFLNVLSEHEWLHDNSGHALQAIYARDTFSNVLETTTAIELDSIPSTGIGSEINLYIGYVGTVILDNENVLSERVKLIQFHTDIPLLLSWLLYGLPQGGRVLPIYFPNDLDEPNPCPNRSHYVAYHDNGNTIIRAVIEHPILIRMWTTSVKIVYPFEEYLEFSSEWIGQFERMDHNPCM